MRAFLFTHHSPELSEQRHGEASVSPQTPSLQSQRFTCKKGCTRAELPALPQPGPSLLWMLAGASGEHWEPRGGTVSALAGSLGLTLQASEQEGEGETLR